MPGCALQNHSVFSSIEPLLPAAMALPYSASASPSSLPSSLHQTISIQLWPQPLCTPELGQEEMKHGLYLHAGIRRRLPVLGLTRVHCEAVGKSPAFTESHSADQDVDRQFILQFILPRPHSGQRSIPKLTFLGARGTQGPDTACGTPGDEVPAKRGDGSLSSEPVSSKPCKHDHQEFS